MAQTPEQIESYIDRKRRDLRSNFEELEDRVKAVTDWRQLVRNNPGPMLAAALGGGLLVSSILGRRRTRRQGAEEPSLRHTAITREQRGEPYRTCVAARKFQLATRDERKAKRAGQNRGQRPF